MIAHPLVLWSISLIQWIILTSFSLNYISLIFTVITVAISFAYTMWYQTIIRK